MDLIISFKIIYCCFIEVKSENCTQKKYELSNSESDFLTLHKFAAANKKGIDIRSVDTGVF